MIPLRLVVVIGLVVKENKILTGLRSDRDLWEFPGGKVEKDESLFNALKREFKEECDLNILNAKLLEVHLCSSFKDRDLCLVFYGINEFEKAPKNKHHKKLEWMSLEKLEKINLLPQNQKIFSRLKESLKEKKLITL